VLFGRLAFCPGWGTAGSSAKMKMQRSAARSPVRFAAAVFRLPLKVELIIPSSKSNAPMVRVAPCNATGHSCLACSLSSVSR